jgi:hypothetical protein
VPRARCRHDNWLETTDSTFTSTLGVADPDERVATLTDSFGNGERSGAAPLGINDPSFICGALV